MSKASFDVSIKARLDARLKNLYSAIAILLSYDHEDYIIAGNSLNAAKPNDFDIYPDNSKFDLKAIKKRLGSFDGAYVVCETRNALTINLSGHILQFCNYSKPTVAQLIESFDFAHIQIGALIHICWEPGDPEDGGGYNNSFIQSVWTTDDYRNAHIIGSTWYTGSDYPLSSLIRCVKYAQRGTYASKHEYKVDVLNILSDIIDRGYSDYADYKDQLSAIDLMLLEPDECNAAWKLFQTCCDRGLVNDYHAGWSKEQYEEPDDDYDF